MSDDYFEFMLKRALDEYAEDEGRFFQEELIEIDEPDFSKDYYKSINKIKRSTKKKHFFSFAVRKVAVVISIFFFAGTVFVYNIDANVKEFINVIFTNRGNQLDISEDTLSFEYDFSKIPDSWECFYVPNYMPAGYKVNYIEADANCISISFSLQENSIVFIIDNTKNNDLSFDLEHSQYKEIYINDFDGYFLESHKTNMVVWSQDGKEFIVTGNEIEDELIKIAENLKRIDR